MNIAFNDRQWTPTGWCVPQQSTDSPDDWQLPGIANIHSHAFQRAMSGLTERRGAGEDSFWSWRERMYALAARFDPDSLRDVAAQLYLEMLEAGYTSVCEFHYLHHAADGKPYADSAAMSLALVEAASSVGIGLLLLPTLYQLGGFDARPLTPRQKRFHLDVDGYLKLLERLDALNSQSFISGVCFHSLRAVGVEAMREVLAARSHRTEPVHLHISEQLAEVDECLALRHARPVAWLLDNFAVNDRWCLVHATHLDALEIQTLAASRACVALCPSTEANLGDGFFPLPAFLDANGIIGIGSDSHASVSLQEELRWLEYGQRLLHQRRNLAAGVDCQSTGDRLFSAAFTGGQQASGNCLDVGCFTLRGDAVELAERGPDGLIDSWIFGSSRPLIRDVWANGKQWVSDGRHSQRDPVERRFRASMKRLLSGG